MMPTPLLVLALRAARKAQPGAQAPAPKDRRKSIRLVWDAAANPARPVQSSRPLSSKER